MRHLVVLVEELRERGVNVRSLTDSIDTSTPMGRFFFHVMGALAEMERELIVERTRAGLEAARARGVMVADDRNQHWNNRRRPGV